MKLTTEQFDRHAEIGGAFLREHPTAASLIRFEGGIPVCLAHSDVTHTRQANQFIHVQTLAACFVATCNSDDQFGQAFRQGVSDGTTAREKSANVSTQPATPPAPTIPAPVAELARLKNALGSDNLARFAASLNLVPSQAAPRLTPEIAGSIGIPPGVSSAKSFDELAQAGGMVRGSELAKQLGFSGMQFSNAVWQGFIKPKPDLETSNGFYWTSASAAEVLRRHKR